MSKNRNNIGKLTGDEQAALGKFQTDFKKAMPHMAELAGAAKSLNQAMIDAPFWSIQDAPKPDGAALPDPWTVGHAQVNYVEHIETEGTQDK